MHIHYSTAHCKPEFNRKAECGFYPTQQNAVNGFNIQFDSYEADNVCYLAVT